MYAQVIANEVTTTGSLPNSARRLDTQEWVMGLATAPVDLQHACGWYEIIDVARPADDATTTYDRSITWDGTNATVTWIARPKTQAELDADTQNTNRAKILNAIDTALTNNIAFLGSTPTNAQTAAQVKALTRQIDGLMRLQRADLLDGTN